MYRLGWPFSKFLAKHFNVNLLVKINVNHDMDENVFIATSDEIPGLVVEAETFEQLKFEVRVTIPELIDLNDFMCKSKTEYSQLEDFCAA